MLDETSWLGSSCDGTPAIQWGHDVPPDHKVWVSVPADQTRWIRLTTDEALTTAGQGGFQYCEACPSGGTAPNCRMLQSTKDVLPAGSYSIPIGPVPGTRFHSIGAQYDPPAASSQSR